MEDKYIIEQTENSITWDYGVPVENYDEWLSGYTNTYTGEELNNMLKVDEAINAMHNHELYIHGMAHDYAPLILGIINTIAIVYLIYKLNTKKKR